jgi:hypothetical protein
MVVIRCWGFADGSFCAAYGHYLARFDVDAHNGRGLVEWTASPLRALRFGSMPEAFTLWRMQSNVQPRRADGRPNRPLTAYNVEYLTLADLTVH